MDTNDQRAIEELFDRLARVEGTAPPRDPEAEAFIRQQIARQPGAPYYMAQTIVVQEEALRRAQERIDELEAAETGRDSGPWGGLFGGGGSRTPARQRTTDTPAYDPRYNRSGAGGGGFLAGAAQTAVGVAGGMMLANMIGGLFGAGEAEAAAPEPDAGTDAGDAGGDFDGGGDFGDMGF